MCRFVAYLGEPIYLEELVCRPRHSLVHQSLQAEEAKVATNGDGFGIGWYGERDEPGVYREVMPAWSDDNLMAICRTVKSGLFFAHVRAATGGGIARQNCHPFRHGRYLFMHNGQIGGYSNVRRPLEAQLPDHLYNARRGATDSELLFLLALAKAERGQDVNSAMHEVLDDVQALMARGGVEQPLRFAAVLSDGRQVHVFRVASDGKPPTLYVQRGVRGDTVASEPLDDRGDGWELVPCGGSITLGAPVRSRVPQPA